MIGVFKINVNGYVVDDLPQNSPINRDLKFFEKNFEGILPLEISVDTKKKNGVLSISTLNKIDKMEKMIASYPEFSRSISLNTGLKYASQAFYNGDSTFYRLPTDIEKNFILLYAANSGKGNGNMLTNFVDNDKQAKEVIKILKLQSIPEIVKINEIPSTEISTILCYNQYLGQNHSLVLLKKC